MEEGLQWFAVRTLFRLNTDESHGYFEEKITMYKVADSDTALKLAKKDASDYLALNPKASSLKHIGVYILNHRKDDLNSTEVWSHVGRGPINPEEYYEAKYGRFELSQEEDGGIE